MRFGPIALLIVICLLIPTMTVSPVMADATVPPQRIVLQLKWHHQFQFAGYYAALDKGFYAAEGLDVGLREGTPLSNATEAVLNGEADFAIGAPSVLMDLNRGRPVVAVAAIFQHSPSVLLTLKDSGIDSPQSLSGRRVMLGGTDGWIDPENLAVLAGEGVTKVPARVVPHSGNLDDLIDGRVDAISAYMTNEPPLLRARGIAFNILRPRQYGIDFYGDILITSLRMATKRPDLVRAFERATRRGWDYAMAHPEEIADLIIARYSQAKTREQLLAEATAMRELIVPDLVEIGHMSRGRWTHIAETFAAVGMLGRDWTLDRFLFHEIDADLRARTDRWLVLGAYVGLGALGLTLLLAGFIARLRALVHRRTRELAASEAQFRTIFDSVNDAIFLLAPEGGAVLSVNQRMCELFGYQRDEFPDLAVSDLGLPGPAGPHDDLSLWLAKARSDRPHPFEWRARAKDGTELWLEIGPRRACIGGVDLLLVVARDISPRKEVEERLRRTIDDLVSSNSDLERFAYVSSHDLQTPLRNVVSYAQLLERRYRGRLDADADEFIGFIVDNTRHMSELINDLIDYTRVGRSTQPLGVVDCGRAVGQALAALAPEIAALGAHVEVGDMPRAIGDESQMVILFQNLIANALKYRDWNRPVEIFLSACRDEAGMWRIAVRDNGIGIEKQYFSKIFEIFQRLHPDHKSSGTGIGLALCQRIVHHFGGRIWVESVPGTGSTFFFTLVPV